MSNKKRKKYKTIQKIYCKDCGDLLDKKSTLILIELREHTMMHNLPAFCLTCRKKTKNKFKGYWFALKEGFKPKKKLTDSES